MPITLESVALAMLIGLLGQGVRMVLGLFKNGEITPANPPAPNGVASGSGPNPISYRLLALTLFMGAIAGGLTALFTTLPADSRESAKLLFAAGYAGADAIEAVMSKVLPTRK